MQLSTAQHRHVERIRAGANLSQGIEVVFERRCGGAEGNRTPDLFHAMEALYQLSYSPRNLA